LKLRFEKACFSIGRTKQVALGGDDDDDDDDDDTCYFEVKHGDGVVALGMHSHQSYQAVL
jgi:hypothetical protein